MPRHREFEPEEVVARAMDVFWRQGYRGTSVQDLVDETGIQRSSLYETFGDKHSLFVSALEHYAGTVVTGRAGILERPGASLPEIREYFAAVVGDLLGKDGRKGCLMANSAVEFGRSDPPVAERVASHLERLERAFATALSRAIDRGQIPAKENARARARFLMGLAQGLIVVGKTRPEPSLLRDIVDSTLGALKS